MKRPRINHVLTAQGAVIIYKESKEVTEMNARKVAFMKAKKMLEGKKVNLELVSFSQGIEKAIREYKQSKKAM